MQARIRDRRGGRDARRTQHLPLRHARRAAVEPRTSQGRARAVRLRGLRRHRSCSTPPLRSDGDYGVTVSVNNATEAAQLLGSEVTIWGVPGDASHDQSRGWTCVDGGVWSDDKPCEPEHPAQPASVPDAADVVYGPVGHDGRRSFLAGEVARRANRVKSSRWKAARPNTGCPVWKAVIGCRSVRRSVWKAKSMKRARRPALKVDVHVPQQSTLEAGALAEADVQSHERDAARRGAVEPVLRERAAGVLASSRSVSKVPPGWIRCRRVRRSR